jgi:type I restriction-modification system DNA methylase subunit
MVRESYIDSDLYHLFRGLQDRNVSVNGLSIKDIKFHYPVDSGEADIYLLFQHKGRDFSLIVETKRKRAGERFDPYSPRVIGQALGYAKYIAAQFIVTSNGDLFLCFDITMNLPILQSIVNDNIKLEFSEAYIYKFLQELEAYLTQKKSLKKLSDRFIERLAYFHQLVTPFFRQELASKLADAAYAKRFLQFCKKRGYSYAEESDLTTWISEQSAYLLLNRVLFYNVLRKYYTNVPAIALINGITVQEFIAKLNQTFLEVMDQVNYHIIFQRANIFDEIPISDELAYLLNEFIEELSQFDVSLINEDVIGKVYEQIIPEIDKHLKGQYYTPQWIANVIAELTISSANDKVLDTSCGSGTFLISAYKKLAEYSTNTHAKIIDQLTGIDINYFPAHLAAFNLIIRNIAHKHNNLKILPLDFFSIRAGQQRLDTLNYLSLTDEALDKRQDFYLPTDFDAVATNPPYTESREIGDANYKAYIQSVALDKKTKLAKSVGIYAYFYTHANHFLKEGGRIGFIVSNSFLETSGGETLCQFFLDNFKIKYMIGFTKNVFETADVKAIITILEKCSNRAEREKNVTKFIKVLVDFNTLNEKEFALMALNIEDSFQSSTYSMVRVPQSKLMENMGWMLYFRPYEQIKLFLAIFKPFSRKLVDFCDEPNIRSCFKAGGYEFFMISRTQNQTLQFESDYVTPIIHSPKDFAKIGITSADTTKLLFTIKDIVKLQHMKNSASEYLKIWMEKDIPLKKGKLKGKTVKGIQNTPTFKGNEDWYKVAEGQITGDLLFQGYVNRDIRCFVNLCGAYSTANYVTIKVPEGKYVSVLALIYNSSLMQFYLELTGTVLGANALYVANYQLCNTPVPALETLSKEKLLKASQIYEKLINEPFASKQFPVIKAQLDEFVFELFEVTLDDRQKVKDALQQIVKARLQGKKKNSVAAELENDS